MNKSIEQLIDRAAQHRRESNFDQAGREWAEVIELSRRQNDTPVLIRALNGAAQIERDLGRNSEASARYEEAVALCRKHGDPLLLAHTIRHLGDVRRHLGQQPEAQACYEEALGIYRSEPRANSLDVANTLRPFAILKEKVGDSTAREHSGVRLVASIKRTALTRALRSVRSILPNLASLLNPRAEPRRHIQTLGFPIEPICRKRSGAQNVELHIKGRLGLVESQLQFSLAARSSVRQVHLFSFHRNVALAEQ